MDCCKVYKGLDTPCKIKGVLSRYFYMIFCSAMMSFVLLVMSASSLLKDGSFFSFAIEAIFELGITVVLYSFFYKRSNKEKIKLDRRVTTVSNRALFKALNKKR